MSGDEIEFTATKQEFKPFKLSMPKCDHCDNQANQAGSRGNYCVEHYPEPVLTIPPTKEVRHYKGNCDVCGEELSFSFSFGIMGIIDTFYSEERKCHGTWIRHIKGTQDGCNFYSSPVYQVHTETVPLSEKDIKLYQSEFKERHDAWENRKDSKSLMLRFW